MSNNTFYFILFGFVLGVVSGSFFDLGLSFIFLFLLVAVSVLLIDKKFLSFSLALIMLSIGVWRIDLANTRDFFLDHRVGERVDVDVVLVEEPSKRENSTQLIVKSDDSRERILITTEKTDLFKYGDLLRISGEVERPENFKTDNNREFDYVNYLSKDNVYYRMVFPEIEITDSNRGNFIKASLFKLKNSLIENTNRVISSPESEYLSGLIFGVKESLGEGLEEDFRRTGLIHVVVLSGYNVTIVADFIQKTLVFLPQYAGVSLGILSIILFALMTGAGATIVRASVMAILVILAKVSGRRYAITRALFIAGFLMILHNPKILIHDPSFQLSFLATLGLIHLSPAVAERLTFLPNKWNIRDLAAATISTQIFVLPLLLNKIGDFSLIAPIANILVLPVIPITMLFGFVTSVLGLISTTLSVATGFISFILLTYQIKVVEVFSSFPFASVEVEVFPLWLMFVVYLGYLYIYRKFSKS